MCDLPSDHIFDAEVARLVVTQRAERNAEALARLQMGEPSGRQTSDAAELAVGEQIAIPFVGAVCLAMTIIP
jgi:hypothetical protein